MNWNWKEDASNFDPIADVRRAAWNEAIDKAQDELVRRDQFSERTLRILDELRIPESDDSGTGDTAST